MPVWACEHLFQSTLHFIVKGGARAAPFFFFFFPGWGRYLAFGNKDFAFRSTRSLAFRGDDFVSLLI